MREYSIFKQHHTQHTTDRSLTLREIRVRMPTCREASQTLDIEGLNGVMAADFAHLVKMLQRV